MTRAIAVIGSAFGDEGKGLMTDYFCNQLQEDGKQPLVVRFNGGAQAGHTVVTPEGRRHVFHHFGSGTLSGCDTFLSKYFIVNPFLWWPEHQELQDLATRLSIDMEAPLTTPYDMLLNREIERKRNTSRHGSCGSGINETVTRNQADGKMNGFETTAAHMLRPAMLRARLDGIRYGYLPQRVKDLCRNDGEASNVLEAIYRGCTDAMIDNYMDVVGQMRRYCSWQSEFIVPSGTDVVFEGAQGLLLDEAHAYFPYVTRSKTGLHNVVKLAESAGIRNVETVYATRAYATRHGPGPFYQDDSLRFDDSTNVPNDWQGTLRFGVISETVLLESLRKDLNHGNPNVRTRPFLAVTCLDQTDDIIHTLDGEFQLFEFINRLQEDMAEYPLYGVYFSHGRTRETITGPLPLCVPPRERLTSPTNYETSHL